jgi:hypothetical protein
VFAPISSPFSKCTRSSQHVLNVGGSAVVVTVLDLVVASFCFVWKRCMWIHPGSSHVIITRENNPGILAGERYDRPAVLMTTCYLQNNGSYRCVVKQNNHCLGWKVYLVQLELSCMLAIQIVLKDTAGASGLLNTLVFNPCTAKCTGCVRTSILFLRSGMSRLHPSETSQNATCVLCVAECHSRVVSTLLRILKVTAWSLYFGWRF